MKRKHTQGSIWKRLLPVVLCVCLVAFAACERALTLKSESDANPPTFKLAGSGDLIFLVVFEVTPGKSTTGDDRVMWKIRPAQEVRVDYLPDITYGIVPPGFTQTEPASGSPPPLLEGKTYEIGGPTINAPGGWTRFTIKGGKSVVIDAGI